MAPCRRGSGRGALSLVPLPASGLRSSRCFLHERVPPRSGSMLPSLPHLLWAHHCCSHTWLPLDQHACPPSVPSPSQGTSRSCTSFHPLMLLFILSRFLESIAPARC